MGAFKPLLPFGKTTVIRSCIANLSAGGVAQIVVVLGHRADDLQAHLAGLGVTLALNPDSESEMSESVICGLRNVEPSSRAVLVMPADHPAVGPEVIKQLIARWKRGSSLIVPTYRGQGGHPVLLDSSYKKQLEKIGLPGGLKVFLAVHGSEVERLPVASPYIARDLDTWDDYSALHQEIFHQPPGSTREEHNENPGLAI